MADASDERNDPEHTHPLETRIATGIRVHAALIAPPLPTAMVRATRWLLAITGLTTPAGGTLAVTAALFVAAVCLAQKGVNNQVVAALFRRVRHGRGTRAAPMSSQHMLIHARRIVPTLLTILALEPWTSTSIATGLGLVLLLLDRRLRPRRKPQTTSRQPDEHTLYPPESKEST